MDKTVTRMVDKAWKLYQSLEPSHRLLIAIAGIPGSGKTTFAGLIASGLNAKHQAQLSPDSTSSGAEEIALVIPLDGYHLTRDQLSALSNPSEAHFRRGAAFTFDAESYLSLVRRLREPITAESSSTTHAPSFSHSLKDPVPNDIAIPPTSRILIFEGLYLALSRPPWSEAASLMDQIWFLDVPLPIAEARVAKRNFAAGLSETLQSALHRTRQSDMRNARDVLENRVQGGMINEVVASVEDESWTSVDIVEEMEKEREREREQTEQQQQASQRGRMDSIAELTASGAGW